MSYQIVKSETLSTANCPRYIVVDTLSGKILDDANGYGYKSETNARKCYEYKTNNDYKAKVLLKKTIRDWLEKHPQIEERIIEDELFAIKSGEKFFVDSVYIRSLLHYFNVILPPEITEKALYIYLNYHK